MFGLCKTCVSFDKLPLTSLHLPQIQANGAIDSTEYPGSGGSSRKQSAVFKQLCDSIDRQCGVKEGAFLG
jgi:hypothetical protein